MKNNKKGFTLIELLVVVLIIGILASIALPQYFKAVEKSKAAEALSLFGSIASAQQRYYLVNDNFSDTFGGIDLEFTDASGNAVTTERTSFTTKNYLIELKGVSSEHAGVLASRTGGKYKFTMCKEYQTGKVMCDTAQDQGAQICPSLGQFQGTSCSNVNSAS